METQEADTSSSVVTKSSVGVKEPSEYEFVEGVTGGDSSRRQSLSKENVKKSVSYDSKKVIDSDNDSEKEVEEEIYEEDNVPSLLEWLSLDGTSRKLLQKVSQTTESVIQALDPTIIETYKSGGDVSISVVSQDESTVSAVRRAFQNVFGKATVNSSPFENAPLSTIADQPVGFASGNQGALERIQRFRSKAAFSAKVSKATSTTTSHVNAQFSTDVVVSLQDFIFEVCDKSWVEIVTLVLSDVNRKLTLTAFTQPVQLDYESVALAESGTPDNYPKKWSGLGVNVGKDILGPTYRSTTGHSSTGEWRFQKCGIKTFDLIHSAAISLATQYKTCLED